ncbi:hypothetical protein [Micromonospora sp. NPDC049679]|uniref:hypothetical protein n=1 Tax=Micromonospora sp. NPDC049679 TaxID=3155920 RepID=UPI0033D1C799
MSVLVEPRGLEPLTPALQSRGGLSAGTPGPDHQIGVVQLSPDAVRSVIDRHSDWKPVSTLTVGRGWAVDDRPRLEHLSAWIPKDAKWQQSASLDAAYVGKQTYASAHYYVDVDHALAVFSSEADNR